MRVLNNVRTSPPRQCPNRLCGFTLIELLLVIAIIATLTFAAIGVTNQYNNNLKIQRTAQQIEQWLAAGQAYYGINNRWPTRNDLIGESYIPKTSVNPWQEPYELSVEDTIQSKGAVLIISTAAPTAAIARAIQSQLAFANVIGNKVQSFIAKPYIKLKSRPVRMVGITRLDITADASNAQKIITLAPHQCLHDESADFTVFLQRQNWLSGLPDCIPNRLELTPHVKSKQLDTKWQLGFYFYYHRFGGCNYLNIRAIIHRYCCYGKNVSCVKNVGFNKLNCAPMLDCQGAGGNDQQYRNNLCQAVGKARYQLAGLESSLAEYQRRVNTPAVKKNPALLRYYQNAIRQTQQKIAQLKPKIARWENLCKK